MHIHAPAHKKTDRKPILQPLFPLIDTHCHISMMVKETFDTPLTTEQLEASHAIVQEAQSYGLTHIINVGTSLVESLNGITLARLHALCYAAIGIHPNDCTPAWKNDIAELQKLLKHKEESKIVAIGECGLDFHYPDYNKQRQYDAFHAQIELALTHELPVIVHTRNAPDETLKILSEYRHNNLRGVIHCFSENHAFAQEAINLNFLLGIGGVITYPKNNELRAVVEQVKLTDIILETDAPFLSPQAVRGTKNYPHNVAYVADFVAQLKHVSREEVAHVTTKQAETLFKFSNA